MEQQVLITKELRLRITELEYENLPPEAYIREIQRIYIEETGKALPVKVEIYKSSESTKIDSESEYSGRAIRFYSEEDNIDEMYIVSEGTQGLKDWLYNVEALVAGKAYGQIDDVNNFTQEALTYFGYSYDSKDENYGIPIVGLGHSQAHNTNASSYLIHDTFTQVYGVNSAQLNYYQLFFADQEFQIDLINKYPILLDDELEIYELDTDVLKQHAMDFYEDKADNIVQELSIQDPLYAVQNFPGFFPLGEVNEYETNKEVPGLKESFDKIPESY